MDYNYNGYDRGYTEPAMTSADYMNRTYRWMAVGLLITFAPALLLPVLDVFGFKNTTFGDFDFSVIGITLGRAAEAFGTTGVYAILAVLLIVAFVPNFIHTKGAVINHVEEE